MAVTNIIAWIIYSLWSVKYCIDVTTDCMAGSRTNYEIWGRDAIVIQAIQWPQSFTLSPTKSAASQTLEEILIFISQQLPLEIL